jgi:hypothetical protein
MARWAKLVRCKQCGLKTADPELPEHICMRCRIRNWHGQRLLEACALALAQVDLVQLPKRTPLKATLNSIQCARLARAARVLVKEAREVLPELQGARLGPKSVRAFEARKVADAQRDADHAGAPVLGVRRRR